MQATINVTTFKHNPINILMMMMSLFGHYDPWGAHFVSERVYYHHFWRFDRGHVISTSHFRQGPTVSSGIRTTFWALAHCRDTIIVTRTKCTPQCTQPQFMCTWLGQIHINQAPWLERWKWTYSFLQPDLGLNPGREGQKASYLASIDFYWFLLWLLFYVTTDR